LQQDVFRTQGVLAVKVEDAVVQFLATHWAASNYPLTEAKFICICCGIPHLPHFVDYYVVNLFHFMLAQPVALDTFSIALVRITAVMATKPMLSNVRYPFTPATPESVRRNANGS
jgi:hypothetical protein